MKLGIRKDKILGAIVKNYIATGEPVGSKSLLNSLDFAVSSATVRNEMAELSEKGYLEQPHTSAGRIPAQKGYRYYIDYLMEPQILSQREKRVIEESLEACADDPEHILSEASTILSQVTGFVAISTTPSSDQTKIARLRIVQTSKHTAMLVMITSAGMVKNRLFHCDFNLNREVLDVFEKALNKTLSGVLLSAVTPAAVQTIAVSLGELSILMPQALLAVMEAAKEASVINLSLKGQTNLLLIQDFDLVSVRGIMRFLSDDSAIEELLFNVPSQLAVMLGTESNLPEIEKTSVAVSRYYIEDRQGGVIAVMGPTRMNYRHTIANLEYVSCLSGKLISELLEG